MKNAIALIGEAYGAEEEAAQTPFVGPSGRELTRMLAEAGIHRADCYLTNVFSLRPRPSNDIATSNLVGPRADGIDGFPALSSGKYIRAEFQPELDRLFSELRDVDPNVIVALGGTATWALLGQGGISKIRGTITAARAFGPRPFKVLPTYHPAAVLRDWSLRHVTVLDLAKAARQSAFPEIRRPVRTIYTEPSLSDLEWFYNEHITNARFLAFDIETSGDQITCIGFAPSRGISLVIPFVDLRKSDRSYWPSIEDELVAWSWVRRYLGTQSKKIAQNGLYDTSFLWRQYGITVNNVEHDTMLLHHALQPESEKGLGFLGSVYCDDIAWKSDRPRGKSTIKRDD